MRHSQLVEAILEAKKRLKILVADNEPHIVRLMELNLGREGYQIVTANTLQEALDKVMSEKPDLVICESDTVAPEINGIKFLDSVCGNPETEELPVIIILDTPEEQIDNEGQRHWHNFSGIPDSVLWKPYNPREVSLFVERILQSNGKIPGGEDNPLSKNR